MKKEMLLDIVILAGLLAMFAYSVNMFERWQMLERDQEARDALAPSPKMLFHHGKSK